MRTVRYTSLDSLRFFAALSVLLTHSLGVLELELFRPHWALKGLADPKAAVCFFFVLSGFVLHNSLRGQLLDFRGYLSFLVRRLYRIYPLYYVSLGACLMAVAYIKAGPHPVYAGNGGGVPLVLAADQLNLVQWIHHVLLVSPGFEMHFLNPPAWTLATEMRVAIFFPFLSQLFRRIGLLGGSMLLILSFPIAHLLSLVTVPTLQFVPLFVLGIFLSEHFERLGNPKQWQTFPLLVIGLVLYGWTGYARMLHTPLWLAYYLSGGGAVLLIWLTLVSPRMRARLETPVLVSLGQMSYGIYILHYSVLLAFRGLQERYPVLIFSDLMTGLAVILVTIVLAFWGFRLIETPCMNLGRSVAKSITQNSSRRFSTMV